MQEYKNIEASIPQIFVDVLLHFVLPLSTTLKNNPTVEPLKMYQAEFSALGKSSY